MKMRKWLGLLLLIVLMGSITTTAHADDWDHWYWKHRKVAIRTESRDIGVQCDSSTTWCLFLQVRNLRPHPFKGSCVVKENAYGDPDGTGIDLVAQTSHSFDLAIDPKSTTPEMVYEAGPWPVGASDYKYWTASCTYRGVTIPG